MTPSPQLLILLLLSLPAGNASAHALHEQLSAMPTLDRHLRLTNFLYQSKKQCSAVTASSFLRIDSNRHAYWSVRCANDSIYIIKLHRDQKTTTVIDCDDDCRAKLERQNKP